MEKSFTQESMESAQEQAVEETIQEDASNDLKEFGVDSDAPDLFSSETENSSSDDYYLQVMKRMMILKYQRS
jgi:cell division protein FtsZ